MKISVLQEKLAKALNNVSRVAAGSRTTLPILNNVLIRVDEDKVTLSTTNLDMAVVDYLPVEKCDNGVITVPAKLIADFVGNLPRGGIVEISVDSNEGEKVRINAGEYSSVLNGAAADEFPELPAIDEAKMVKFTMKAEEFRVGAGQVIIAAASDLTRPILTGMLFVTRDNSLFMVATDGYSLSERRVDEKTEAEVNAVVPANSIRTVLGLLTDDIEEIEILFDDSQVRFRFGELEVTSKLMEGSYVNYASLLPQESEVHIEVAKDELTRVTKLAALFARGTNGTIKFLTNAEAGTLNVSSIANELGENSSEIKVEVDTDGKFILNSKFLLEFLSVVEGKKIQMRFSNRLDPMMLRSAEKDNFRHMIMPLKG